MNWDDLIRAVGPMPSMEQDMPAPVWPTTQELTSMSGPQLAALAAAKKGYPAMAAATELWWRERGLDAKKIKDKEKLAAAARQTIFSNPDIWARVRHPEQERYIDERLMAKKRARPAPITATTLTPEQLAAQAEWLALYRAKKARKNYGLGADLAGGMNEVLLIGALLLGGGFLYKKFFAKKVT